MDAEFTPEQKRYLDALVAGMTVARVVDAGGAAAGLGGEPAGPDAAHLRAMALVEAGGATLTDQERFKREEHPFDAYARMKAQAESGEYPKPADNYRWRFHGLFYVAPNQNAYMCRLRLPNGMLNHWQMAGLAMLARTHGGGYAHVTTRANLQIREIEARNAVGLVEAIQSLGLHTRGAGADNIRNVTGSATAGIDPQELIDTRPLARAWHFHVLNDRSLSGLPRKFNVAFDGGGQIGTLEDTNDIGFQAVEVVAGGDVEPGIWLRLNLGGITGHKAFAQSTGLYLQPDRACAVAEAIVRVFIDHGDRTNRAKARLKYLLDAWGLEKFITELEARLGAPLARIADDLVKPRPAPKRLAHIGVHKQKQKGLNWLGVYLPTGHISADQMQALAEAAAEFGDGDIRLTIWQNLILSGVPDARVDEAVAALARLGLKTDASPVRAGLVACTGNTGCKFAHADTKDAAELIAARVESRLNLDQPINIHITGCPHSCAQHYVGDIGLVACKVDRGEDSEPVEGFHVFVGGGAGAEARLAREYAQRIATSDCLDLVENLLRAYLAHRASADESFLEFAARHDIGALHALVDEAAT